MQAKVSYFPQKISSIFHNHPSAIIFLLIFGLNLILVSPELMPNYLAVNPDDEAKYVDSGWRLLRGDIRDLAWGPLVALIYAPVHLIVGASPDWFMLELWIGRYIMFIFLWWSIFYLGYQLKDHLSPYILVAVLFITTPFLTVVVNQSDAVFTGFSSLALANLVKYFKTGKVKDLGFASLFVGFGVLSRVETIILLVTLVAFGIVIGKGKVGLYKILLWSFLPLVIVLGLYFAASLVLMGRIDLGTEYKSYDSFEMNQSILTGGDINLARQETRRLFGTHEENQGSILRAILRNPPAFASRILANAKTIPANYLKVFDKKLGPILLLFSVIGVYALIRKKAWMLIALLLIWPIHSLVALGFLASHIVPQTIYLPMLLGSIGITQVFTQGFNRVYKWIFLFFTCGLFAISWLINKPAFLLSFLLLGFVLIILILTTIHAQFRTKGLHYSIFLLLVAGIILRQPYLFPNYPGIGKSSNEQAIHYLEAELPPLSMILVPTPLPAIASRMSFETVDNVPEPLTSISAFSDYLHQNDIQAVFLDEHQQKRSDILDLMDQDVEQYFTLGYVSEDNTIQIFLVK